MTARTVALSGRRLSLVSTASAVRIEARPRSCGRGGDRRRCRRVPRVDDDRDSHDARPVRRPPRQRCIAAGSGRRTTAASMGLLSPRRCRTPQLRRPATSVSDTTTSETGNGPLLTCQGYLARPSSFRLILNSARARQPALTCVQARRAPTAASAEPPDIDTLEATERQSGAEHLLAVTVIGGGRQCALVGSSGRCPKPTFELALEQPLHTPEREAMQDVVEASDADATRARSCRAPIEGVHQHGSRNWPGDHAVRCWLGVSER